MLRERGRERDRQTDRQRERDRQTEAEKERRRVIGKVAWFGHVWHHDSLSKTIPQGTLEVGDAMVGRGNAEWTTSKSGHPCSCQNCS